MTALCNVSCLFKVSLTSVLAGVSLIAFARTASASGFALMEHSVSNYGTGASGGAAGLDDISTIFFNPAGLMRLPEDGAVVGAGFVIFPNAKFTNQGSVIVPGVPATGGDGGNIGPTFLIPNVYGALRVSDRMKLGIGVTVPFGLAVEYDSDWVGRYQAIKSELVTININPAVAYQVTDTLSIGVGVNVQYAEAELSNAIDFGGILAAGGAAILPQQADGAVNLLGSDWSVGYNVGILYEPTETTRVGLAYRSAINHTLRGNADFTVPAVATAVTAEGWFTDASASTRLNLPDTLSLGINQKLNPQLTLTGDITWTNWSDFQELRVDFDSPQPDAVTTHNWFDTVRVGVGLTYELNHIWTFRGGVAYDPTPVPQEFLTPGIPDSDRTWLSLGLSYEASQTLSLDLAYTHIFFARRRINQTQSGAGTLIGNYSASADIVGAQLNWRF